MFLANTLFVHVCVGGCYCCPGVWFFSLEDLLLPVQPHSCQGHLLRWGRDQGMVTPNPSLLGFGLISGSSSLSPSHPQTLLLWGLRRVLGIYTQPQCKDSRGSPFLHPPVWIGQEGLWKPQLLWFSLREQAPPRWPSQWSVPIEEAGRLTCCFFYCQRCCRPVFLPQIHVLLRGSILKVKYVLFLETG